LNIHFQDTKRSSKVKKTGTLALDNWVHKPLKYYHIWYHHQILIGAADNWDWRISYAFQFMDGFINVAATKDHILGGI
jgi:hypothetical protein